jgi:mannose-1-phosphate guanylyltransferase
VEAIVLVGGQGTRLRPLTLTTPKPMLPVANVPFITHQLLRLRAAGVTHVVLATSYRAEVFAAYLGDGSQLGLAIDYVTETDPLGTGGGIRNASRALRGGPDAPVVVLNGDVLSGHDIHAQIELHIASAADATLHLVVVDDARAFGCVPTDTNGRVTAFLEKMPQPVSDQINAGCYVLRRSVIDEIPANVVVSIERQTFPELLAAGANVHGFVDSAYWLDVGTPAAIVQASADLVRGIAPSPAVRTPGPLLVDDGAQCAEADVGGGSAIGADAVVAAGACVDGSIIGAGAVVERDAHVLRSAIGPGAHIGAGTRVVDAVVGAGARIGAFNELAAGARVWPEVELPDRAIRFSTDA